MAYSSGIKLKKSLGQHFLRDPLIPHNMVHAVAVGPQTSVFEIGCGDGFLTRAILQARIARLWIFEIDPEWATYVRESFYDNRLQVFEQNFLTVDLEKILAPHSPWTVLANLPYQITFPILHRFKEHRHLLKEGVVMVQEEVAQKIVKTHGRGYGFPALYFQHFFEWKLMDKIPPTAFHPAPKVHSRLLYFKPRAAIEPIAREQEFWEFIKLCFKQPRRTMRNNLASTEYDYHKLSADVLALRAQQMNKEDFLAIWQLLIG